MEEQIDKQQSISNTEAEVTVICVDNTTLVTKRAGVYIAQELWLLHYIVMKKSKYACAHPDNMMALVPMGPLQGSSYVRPTRDLDEILYALKGLLYWGQMCIPTGDALILFINSDLPKRRLLVFSGGRLTMDSAELERCATRLKEFDVAVDVVNFGIQRLRPRNKFQLLKDFVSVVDNGGNSRHLYAPSGSPTPLWQQILEFVSVSTCAFSKARGAQDKAKGHFILFQKETFFIPTHLGVKKRNRPNPIIFPDGDGDGGGNGKHGMGMGITIPKIPQPVAIPSRGRENNKLC
ncbi:26S proteasome non-ATPase regulatory subunit 4 [Tanacetum coccineum]|uniref:26S proteasome non-ATPase regulatory subunit 4 n=1 Tax=Tanacetum coccineum TaxID=301880 RepID=A0ABQ5AGS5_9ASTR